MNIFNIKNTDIKIFCNKIKVMKTIVCMGSRDQNASEVHFPLKYYHY